MLIKNFIIASEDNGRQIYLVTVPENAAESVKAGDLVAVKRTDYRNKNLVKETLFTSLSDVFQLDAHEARYRTIRRRVTVTDDTLEVVALYNVTRYDEEEDTDTTDPDTGGDDSGSDNTDPTGDTDGDNTGTDSDNDTGTSSGDVTP